MKIDMPNVPELDEVEGAEEADVMITRVPCGTCYTTRFFKGSEVIRQDQQVVVDPKHLVIEGSAQLIKE